MARPLEFRERTEELERASLSTWATLATETKGRDRHEDADALRTVFQVDADRIVSSPAFRALGGKRSWLPVGTGPSRMQQTLVVARVAGMIARALRLNEDLVTAIAYGHALGSTPFADAGEEALSAFVDDSYDPADEAVRIVEAADGGGAALNLTWETRDGILHHRWRGPAPATVEGQSVRVAVRLVSVVWPAAEALRDGRLRPDDVPAALRAQVGAADWAAPLAYRVARDSVDAPEIVAGADLQEALDALEAAVATLRQRDDVVADRHRAVHCLRSLVVYEVERRQARPEVLLEVLQGLALATEAEVLTRFRSAFEPSSGAAPSARG